jgi:hypothetical protein
LGTWLKAGAERSAPVSAPATPTDAPTLSGVAPEPAVPRSNGSLVRIDAATGAIVSRVPIRFPKLLASDGRSVWVFDEGNQATPELIQVDAVKGGLPKAAIVQLPDALVEAGGVDVATALAAAGRSVWLRDDAGGIYVLRPGARAVEPTTVDALGLGSQHIDVGMVGDGDSLWVPTHPPGPCCIGPSDLQQVDPGTGQPIARFDGAGQVVASGTGFVWAAVVDAHAHAPVRRLVRIDTETHVSTPIGPRTVAWADLTVANGAVWASTPDDDTIVRLDPKTGVVIDWIHLQGGPGALDAGAGAIWAVLPEDRTVARYDIETGQVDTIDVGGTPSDLVFAGSSVWVTVLGSTGLTVVPEPIPRKSRIVEGVRFSFRVPTKAWSNGPISPQSDSSGFRAGRLYISQSIMGPQGAEAVIFWTSFPDGARADPCDDLLSPTMGASAADLATAVATAPGTKLVEGPSNVTVGRLPAKHVVLTVRRDIGCDPGFFYSWHDGMMGSFWPGTNVGDTIRVWIVDVDDTRLFIEAETTRQADAELEKEIQQIIGSIRFG